jgi:phosphatidylethanolamine-binding protein (PEBP) family uncharacterized protein
LALVVAVLVLSGCGGGSSDSSSPDGSGSASPDASTGSSPGGSSADPAADAAGDSGSETGSASAKQVGKAASPAGGAPPSAGGKPGSSVPLPTGEPEPGITPQQRREATVASMLLESPSSRPSSGGPSTLPAEYTCDGKNTSPALRWQGTPQGTAELVLFAMNIQPVGGKLFFDWAVGGLSPDLEEIEAGELPKGAVVGRNSFGKTGYGICPEGSNETYMFTLFALPEKLSPAPGFDPLALRKAVNDVSGNAGLLALSYTRG